MSRLQKMTDWDLVNSFITEIWRIRVDNKNPGASNEKMSALAYEFRDELMRRLSQK